MQPNTAAVSSANPVLLTSFVVRFRNRSSMVSSPRISSSSLALATSRPSLMITTWSGGLGDFGQQMAGDEDRAALRGPARSRPRSHLIPSGSRPLAGSSRISASGSPSRAAARPRRCFMPSEKAPARRSAAPARSTNRQHRVDARRVQPAGERAGARVRPGGAAWVAAGGLQRRADRAANLAVRVAVDERATRVRLDQAEQHPDSGGLADDVDILCTATGSTAAQLA